MRQRIRGTCLGTARSFVEISLPSRHCEQKQRFDRPGQCSQEAGRWPAGVDTYRIRKLPAREQKWVDLTVEYVGSIHFTLNLEPLDQITVLQRSQVPQ